MPVWCSKQFLYYASICVYTKTNHPTSSHMPWYFQCTLFYSISLFVSHKQPSRPFLYIPSLWMKALKKNLSIGRPLNQLSCANLEAQEFEEKNPIISICIYVNIFYKIIHSWRHHFINIYRCPLQCFCCCCGCR